MLVLHCSLCDNPVFKSDKNPVIEFGAVLMAQEWTYMDGTETQVGDPFFCLICNDYFQPLIQKVTEI